VRRDHHCLPQDYADLCVPDWLESEPEFYWYAKTLIKYTEPKRALNEPKPHSTPAWYRGFWGGCFNDYRDTGPHEGYAIIRKWTDAMFRQSDFAERIRARLQDGSGFLGRQSEDEPYKVDSYPGAFYLFTSNVDAHSFDHFEASEIRECHGNIECFQCDQPCIAKIWRAPEDLRFALNKETMTATIATAEQKAAMEAETEVAKIAEDEVDKEDEEDGPGEEGEDQGSRREGGTSDGENAAVVPAPSSAPNAAVGRINGRSRLTTLRYMPPPQNDPATMPKVNGGSIFPPGAIPMCPSCGEPARPSILMFEDDSYIWHRSQDTRWKIFKKCVAAEIREISSERKARVAILEIGAGSNVTTVRNTSEQLVSYFNDASVSLIRVNPELPLADDPELVRGDYCEMIPIMSYGLDAIKRIDKIIEQWQEECEEGADSGDLARRGDLRGFAAAVGAAEGAEENAK